jgi:transcriptional regulator with XRE-family HTH domain
VAENPNAFVARVVAQLQDARERKGITTEQLAEALDTAEQNVRRMLTSQNLTLRTVGRLCAALGLRAEIVLTDAPRPLKLPIPGRRRAPPKKRA